MMEVDEDGGGGCGTVGENVEIDVDARTSLCLICSNTQTPYAGGTPIIYDGIVASGLRHVFKHLMQQPFSEVEGLYSSVTRRSLICHKCSEVVKQIYEDNQKVSALQVMMQHRAEALGEIIRVNVDDTVSEDLDVNKQFRAIVKLNYAEGKLPNLAVRLTPSAIGLKMQKARYGGGVSAKMKRILANGETSGDDEDDDEDSGSDRMGPIDPKRIKMEPVEQQEDELPLEYICPRCECSFSAETDEDRSLVREQFYKHYLNEHSPVREDDVSIDEEGRNCYKCTMCTYSSPIDEIPGRILECAQEALDKLMEHILDSHDGGDGDAAGQDSMYPSGGGGGIDLVRDLDYFKCPEQDCPFVVTITDVNGLEDFKEKSRLAITKLCNHSIFVHAGAAAASSSSAAAGSGNSMKHPCFINVNEKRGSFKCFKCDFVLEFISSSIDERQSALRTFNNHYISHIRGKEVVPIESIKCPLCPFVTRRDLDITTVLKYPSEQGQILVRNMNQHFMENHRGKEIPKFATVRKILLPLGTPPAILPSPNKQSSSSAKAVQSSSLAVAIVPEVEELEVVDIAEGDENELQMALVDATKERRQLHCPECDFKVTRKGSLWTQQKEAIDELKRHYTKHISIPSVLVNCSMSYSNEGKVCVATKTYKCTLCTTFEIESKEFLQEDQDDPRARATSLINLAEHYLMEHFTINESSEDGSLQDDNWRFDLAEGPQVVESLDTGNNSKSHSDSLDSNDYEIVSANCIGIPSLPGVTVKTNESPVRSAPRLTVITPTQQVVSVPADAFDSAGQTGEPGSENSAMTTAETPKRKRGRPRPSESPSKSQSIVARARTGGARPGRRRRKGKKVRRVAASRRARGGVRKVPATITILPGGGIKRGRGRPPKIKVPIKQEPQEAIREDENTAEFPPDPVLNGNGPISAANEHTETGTSRGTTHVDSSRRFPKRQRKSPQVSNMVYTSVKRRTRAHNSVSESSRSRERSVRQRRIPENQEDESTAVKRRNSKRRQTYERTEGQSPENNAAQNCGLNSSNADARLGYQCPKCDFVLDIDDGSGKTKSSRTAFNRHYFVNHSPVSAKDPIFTDDDGKLYYPCMACDFKSYVNDGEDSKIVMRRYMARYALGVHFLKCHEGEGAYELVNLNSIGKTALPNQRETEVQVSSNDKVDQVELRRKEKEVADQVEHRRKEKEVAVNNFTKYSCPDCPFLADDRAVPEKYHKINRKNLIRHYAQHIKQQGIEVQKSGALQYFQCPKCEFQATLKTSIDLDSSDASAYAVVRYRARLEIAEHILIVHEKAYDFTAEELNSPPSKRNRGRPAGARGRLRLVSRPGIQGINAGHSDGRTTVASGTQSDASSSLVSRTTSIDTDTNSAIPSSITSNSSKIRSPIKDMIRQYTNGTGQVKDSSLTSGVPSGPPDLPKMPQIHRPSVIATRRLSDEMRTSPKLRKMILPSQNGQEVSTDPNRALKDKELPVLSEAKGNEGVLRQQDAISKKSISPTPRAFQMEITRKPNTQFEQTPME